MRAHDFGPNMTPVNVSLCAETFRLAKNKSNFSDWVRNKLRSERNQSGLAFESQSHRLNRMREVLPITTAELLFHLERRSEDEITALVSILQGALPQQ